MEDNSVNFWYIWAVFSALIDAEASDGPLNLDSNDEKSMKAAYRRYLVPCVQCLPPHDAAALKRSFIYFLNEDHFPVDEILGSTPDLSMNEPQDPRALFEWLWDVLYPGADWRGVLIEGTRVENNIMRVNNFGAIGDGAE